MEMEESTRPSISFPLGLVLLAIIMFCMSGLFTCCLHWDKLRSLFLPSREDQNSRIQEDIDHLPHKSAPPHMKSKQSQAHSLPVLMPGDQVPKFIAMACPCEPPVIEKITVKVQKPPVYPIPPYL